MSAWSADSSAADATGVTVPTASPSIDETDKQTQLLEKDVKCDVCGECRPGVVVLRCDACHSRVHLTCTVPRLVAKPRQRRWWCDACRQNPVSGSWSLTASETSGDMDKDVKKLQREKERHQLALDKAERQRVSQEREEQWQQQQQKEAEGARQNSQQPSESAAASASSSSSSAPAAVKSEQAAAADTDEKMSDESEEFINRKRKAEGAPEVTNEQHISTDSTNSPKRLRSSIAEGSADTAAATVPSTTPGKQEATASAAIESPSAMARQLSTPLKGPVPLARKAPIPLGSSPLNPQSTLQRTAFPPAPATPTSNAQFALGVTDQKLEQQRLDALKAKIKEAKDQQLQKHNKSEPSVSKPAAGTASSTPQPAAVSSTNASSTAPPPSPSATAYPPLQTATKSPLKANKAASPAKPAAKSPRNLTTLAAAPATEPPSSDSRHTQFQSLLLKHLKTFPESKKLESQTFKKKIEPVEPPSSSEEEMKEKEKKAKATTAASPLFVQTNALNELVLSIDSSVQKRYGDKYVSTFRTLISNLRANNDITKQVLAGTISPAQLSSMQSSDFDDAEARARKHALAQEEMKMSIKEKPKQNNALAQYTESVIDQLGVLNATSLERSAAKSESDANNADADAPPPLEGFDYLKHAINNPPSLQSVEVITEMPALDQQPPTPKGDSKSLLPSSKEKPQKPKELITVSDDDSEDIIMEEDIKSFTRASLAASKMEAAAKNLPDIPDFDNFDAQMPSNRHDEDMDDDDQAPTARPIGYGDDDDDDDAPRGNRSPSPPNTSSVRDGGGRGSSVASSLSSHRSDSPSSFASVDSPSRTPRSQVEADALWTGFMRWGKELIGLRAVDISQSSSTQPVQVFKNSMPKVVDISMRAPFPTVLHSFKQASAALKAEPARISSKGSLAIARLENRDRSLSSAALHPLHKIIDFHTNKERIALVKWKTKQAELGSCEGFLIMARSDGILSASVLHQLFGVPIEVGSVYLCVHVIGAEKAVAKKPSTPTASSRPSASTPTAAAAPSIPPSLQALSSITSQSSVRAAPPALQRSESQNSQYSLTNAPYPAATPPAQPTAVAYPYPPSQPSTVPVPIPAPSHLPYPMQSTEVQPVNSNPHRAPPASHYPAAPAYNPPPSADWDRNREREPAWGRDRQYEQDSYRNPRDSRDYSPGKPPLDPRRPRSRSRSRSPSRRYSGGAGSAAPVVPSSGGGGRVFVHPDRGAMVPGADRDRDRYDNRGSAPRYGNNNDPYRGRVDYDNGRRPYQGGRDYGNNYSPQRPRTLDRERGFDREREWDRNREADRSHVRDAQQYPSQHSQSGYHQPPSQSHSAQSYPYPSSSSYDSAPSRDVPASALPYPAQAPHQPYPAATRPQYNSSQSSSYPQPPSSHSQYAHPPPPPPPPPPHGSREAPWLRK